MCFYRNEHHDREDLLRLRLFWPRILTNVRIFYENNH